MKQRTDCVKCRDVYCTVELTRGIYFNYSYCPILKKEIVRKN